MLRVDGALGDFNDPSAEMLAWMRSLLVDDAEGLWSRKRGEVGFFVTSQGNEAYLVLKYAPGYGYHVLHKGFRRSEAMLVRDGGDDSPVTIYFGGEPEEVSSRAFVPPATAWALVERYRNSGERPEPPDGTQWVES
jgi:hypothetical protein